MLDIILMIADPSKNQIDEPESSAAPAVPPPAATALAAQVENGQGTPTHTGDVAGSPRWQALDAAGFNPMNLAAGHVEFDLKTDSWAQLSLPAIDRQMAGLFAQIQRPIAVNASLRRVFPFACFTLTASGRAAEELFCEAWEKKGRVPQNILFPSTLYHQIDKGFSPREIPAAGILDLQSSAPFKGDIDLSALKAELEAHAADIGYVCIELTDNAGGGGAVSLGHLKQVRTLLDSHRDRHRAALVLDATRVIENALVVI